MISHSVVAVKREAGKQAFHIHRPDGQLFAFAKLWEHWDHGGEILYSCTIITTDATGLTQPIHERMPGVAGFARKAARHFEIRSARKPVALEVAAWRAASIYCPFRRF